MFLLSREQKKNARAYTQLIMSVYLCVREKTCLSVFVEEGVFLVETVEWAGRLKNFGAEKKKGCEVTKMSLVPRELCLV